MATLTIGNLSPRVVNSLKSLARTNRRSMEQEVRELLLSSTRTWWPIFCLAPWLLWRKCAGWMAIRTGVITAEEGARRLRLAGRLGIRSVPSKSLWEGALSRAVYSGVAVYDTLFVELAVRQRLPMATFDSRLLAAFPEIARRPRAG
jgi:predicted nucleic acid-binding protein